MIKCIIIWTENGEKHWDKIEEKDLFHFMIEKDAANDEDTMIFKPSFKLKITEDEETIGYAPPKALENMYPLIEDDAPAL